ncbi:hypothetical protein M404DRAFT_28695 [Pisolithus tinctorius Marx 270]|uniref:Uncharacterized protein n=1 Tax=Pisolithus tinctorius Marx 270 TaxID=870435 RepID=A0A0C3NKE8_PISTI|nr:hypothetical protein M404DRAFT_28695 [Pisolithus tinctorius Marx 270]
MSANHAPCLSNLEQLTAASAGLMAEAKCVPDDREDMQEEKMTWLRHWEEKTAVLMPLVEQGKALGVSMWVDAEDAPTLVEADDLYKWWTMEEAEARTKAEQDIQTGEETAVEVGDKGMGVKMSHVEVPQPARKGCKKSMKAVGKRVRAGASIARSSKAPKASPSKRAHDDNDNDNNIMEVVESRTHGKGKTSGRSTVSNKTATDLSQDLTMVRAEAVATHAANLRLQVHIEQLAEALAEHGIE